MAGPVTRFGKIAESIRSKGILETSHESTSISSPSSCIHQQKIEVFDELTAHSREVSRMPPGRQEFGVVLGSEGHAKS